MLTKNRLTPEQQEMLNILVKDAFSSVAVHFIGDRLPSVEKLEFGHRHRMPLPIETATGSIEYLTS